MRHRIQVTLTDQQYARLREESRRSGLGLAELVRRALDRSYRPPAGPEMRGALDASFASWRDRDFDGAGYVEELRRGMSQRLPD